MGTKSQEKQGKNGFDIARAEQEIEAGIVVPIKDHRNLPAIAEDGTPVSITVVGSGSHGFRKASDCHEKRTNKRRGEDVGLEQQLRDDAEFSADCCLDWHGFSDNGAPLPFSRDHAVALFTRLPFIKRQIFEAVKDHRGFFGATSSNGSSPS